MSLPPGLTDYGTRHGSAYDFSLHTLLRAPDWRRHWRILGPWPSTYGGHLGQPGSERWPTLDFDLETVDWRDPDTLQPFTAKLTVLLTEMFDDACHLCMSMVPIGHPPERVSMDGRLFCSSACSGLAAEIELTQRLSDRDYLSGSFGTEVEL